MKNYNLLYCITIFCSLNLKSAQPAESSSTQLMQPTTASSSAQGEALNSVIEIEQHVQELVAIYLRPLNKNALESAVAIASAAEYRKNILENNAQRKILSAYYWDRAYELIDDTNYDIPDILKSTYLKYFPKGDHHENYPVISDEFFSYLEQQYELIYCIMHTPIQKYYNQMLKSGDVAKSNFNCENDFENFLNKFNSNPEQKRKNHDKVKDIIRKRFFMTNPHPFFRPVLLDLTTTSSDEPLKLEVLDKSSETFEISSPYLDTSHLDMKYSVKNYSAPKAFYNSDEECCPYSPKRSYPLDEEYSPPRFYLSSPEECSQRSSQDLNQESSSSS